MISCICYPAGCSVWIAKPEIIAMCLCYKPLMKVIMPSSGAENARIIIHWACLVCILMPSSGHCRLV